MKRIIFSGLALALVMSGGMALAQNNSGYTDDVYYNASKASNAAEQQADTDAAYDDSVGQNYQDSDYANEDDNQYIDYNDDDSYAGRIRRFYYPMASVGYWGGVYSPFWMNPYPSYGWGNGWYSPGFSMSFGWSPYWASSWFFGWGGYYGGYYSSFYNPYFYNPYYGYGGGYGYWNGYNDGWHNGRNNGYAGRYNYGPRGVRSSNGVRGIGNYGQNSRTTPLSRTANTVRPQRATVTPTNNLGNVERLGNRQVVDNNVRLGNTRVYNNNMPSNSSSRQAVEMNRGNASLSSSNAEVQTSRKAFRFNRSDNNVRSSTEQQTYRSYSPPARSSESSSERSYTPPARSYSPPARSSAPSRSYSAPSRSSSSSSSRSMRR